MNENTFQDFDFDEALQRTIQTEKFEIPTPVQAQAIAPALDGRDILASAQTGSGKTAAFVLPMLHRLSREQVRPERGRPRALILAPTRELAGQIAEVIHTFTRNIKLSSVVIYGGVSKGPQISALRRGVDIVVATPGRLLDLMSENFLTLSKVQMIVLDEADRMLDMGFIPDIKRIIKELPAQRQSLFFSATLPEPVKQLVQEMLVDPVRISIKSDKSNEPDIDQQIMFVARDQKRDALRMILTEYGSYRALVFTRTKHRARDLAKYLGKNGISSDDLHGDKSQNARSRALAAFHRGKIQVLVATDIASRGIDVDDIDHVINYELPNESESYVHRIGRTARAGKSGIALTLCDETELDNLGIIQKALQGPIPVMADHPFHNVGVAEAATRTGRSRSGGNSGGGGRSTRGGNRSGNGGRNHRGASNNNGGNPGGARGGRPGGGGNSSGANGGRSSGPGGPGGYGKAARSANRPR